MTTLLACCYTATPIPSLALSLALSLSLSPSLSPSLSLLSLSHSLSLSISPSLTHPEEIHCYHHVLPTIASLFAFCRCEATAKMRDQLRATYTVQHKHGVTAGRTRASRRGTLRHPTPERFGGVLCRARSRKPKEARTVMEPSGARSCRPQTCQPSQAPWSRSPRGTKRGSTRSNA